MEPGKRSQVKGARFKEPGLRSQVKGVRLQCQAPSSNHPDVYTIVCLMIVLFK